ncbi:MAG: mannitol-1-phosphate 5-dehydrogenase [Spirochaeta sp.]|jgi:mannitol-1-phosphate 5-dehydrogenase|nr:mannitol-1-phosphate 5-dehydrogenase [Spirochaeta sp.]
MNKICIFGAGNIGRSFIGRVFSASGYEVVFIDVDQRVIDALNRRGSYEIVEKSDDHGERRTTVKPVRGVLATDSLAVAKELAGTSVAATAVGGGAFGHVITTIATTLSDRSEPLDLIMAENIHGAAGLARQHLQRAGVSRDTIDRQIGLVETSIGKMVPIMPAEVRRRDPLLCWAEPYNTLIVDAAGFLNAIPDVGDLKPVSPIAPWVERKLYIHNMGHAATAYLGHLRNRNATYIWELLTDTPTRQAVAAAMERSAEALARRYPAVFTSGSLREHVDDLLRRFSNRALGDTVYRVGRDLHRKLRRDDRIVGSIELALRAGVDPSPIVAVFHAAPHFTARDEDGSRLPGDEECVQRVEHAGTAWILNEIVDLGDGTEDRRLRAILSSPDSPGLPPRR